ncbi:MAG: ATP-binding protein [Methanobacterium sp.]
MAQSIKSSNTNSWTYYLAWLPIPFFLILISIFAWFRPEFLWNPPEIFTLLNIIFLTLIMIFVSIIAIRSYMAKRSLIILLLGSGSLALGLGGLIAGIAILGNNPNSTISIYNTSACISGIFILASAILSTSMNTKILRSIWPLLTSYIAVIVLIGVVAFLVGAHFWPVYFVEGTGPTGSDLAVLYTTILLFAISSILLLIQSTKVELNFRIWYGLGLGLIAVGLIGVSLQIDIGDALNWMGRISQYLGAVYILIAIILSIRETGVWLLPWQQSLYEMEEKYHSLYTSMNEGVAIHKILYDQAGKAVDYIIMDVNPSYEEILDLKREDVIERKATEVYGTDNPPYLNLYSSVVETGNPKTFEVYFEPMDRYFNISVFSPKYEEFATVFEDITERRKTEDELKRSEARFRSVLKNSLDVVYRYNLQTGHYDYMSPAIRALGYEPEEMMAMSNDEVMSNVHPDDIEDLKSVISEINQSGKGVAEYRFRGNDDIYRWWSNQMVIVKDTDGKPIYRDGSVRDVTKKRQIEDQVKLRTEELAKSNADLKQFAYIASHDLREPLRMITNFLQLLDRRYKDRLDEDADEFIGFAVDGAKRLDSMIMDLLEYSRVANKEIHYTDVDLEVVLHQIMYSMDVLIKENNVQITYDALPTIKSDENLMVRLFQNLISNAIKYRSNETPKIHISSKKEDGNYVFGVKDNGIGINPKHLEQIFTIFKRLHTHQEYEGSGIGLSIAQKIVHQHGGEIWAESKPEEGSTFYFTLPYNTERLYKHDDSFT